MDAAANPPPEYDRLESCAALGGLTTTRSPRCFLLRVDVALCQGWGPGSGRISFSGYFNTLGKNAYAVRGRR
jgi:hypothetical protein